MDYDPDTEGDHKDSGHKGAPVIIFSFLLLTEPGFDVNVGRDNNNNNSCGCGCQHGR